MTDLDALYRLHASALLRYLIRLTGDPELAADALQETFVRLVERPPRDLHSRAWLFTVATNLVREEGRTAARRRGLLDRGAASAAFDRPDGHGADDLMVIDERRRIVLGALATLSERDRTALLMREEGFTHEEIASAVDTTTKSVGTIIARALRKLALALEPFHRELA
jgi:RNA polymerase sigma factor (sigma-70 family)